MTMVDFSSFQEAFPLLHDGPQNSFGAMADIVFREFEVDVPDDLAHFWETCAPGYYGENELYFFGPEDGLRHSLVEWNRLDCWKSIQPPPRDGGPVFIGETCFGDQFGFRWVEGRCIPVLCILDTMESFNVGENFTDVFENVLRDRFAFTDPERYAGVVARLGRLPTGMHFAPIDFPLLGGSGDPKNFCIQDPVVHMTLCASIYVATKDLPPGTRIDGITIDWS